MQCAAPDFETLYSENLSKVYKLALSLSGNAGGVLPRAGIAGLVSRRKRLFYMDIPHHRQHGEQEWSVIS